MRRAAARRAARLAGMEAHAGAQACGTQAPEAAATEPLTLESLLSADVDVLDLICGYEDGLRGFGRETASGRCKWSHMACSARFSFFGRP